MYVVYTHVEPRIKINIIQLFLCGRDLEDSSYTNIHSFITDIQSYEQPYLGARLTFSITNV